MQRFASIWVGGCVMACLWSTAAWGAEVTIGAQKDNTLYQSASGAFSNGAGMWFFAGRTGQMSDSIRRGLIAFDVAGKVPTGARIQSVQLTLNMSRTLSGDMPLSLHRVTRNWGEGMSDAGGNEGSGAPATTGDATWIHTFFNTGFWDTAGGDFDPNASATIPVGLAGRYTWGSTSNMVADVQRWLDTPAESFGWLVRGNEASGSTVKRFDTRENTVPENRPALKITYSIGQKGDLNCDGAVNFADINPFVLALSNPEEYKRQFPNCDVLNGDINNDGAVNFADINPFVQLLGG